MPRDIHLDAAGEQRLHRALRRCWHPVGRVDDLQDKPLPVTLLDEQLVVVRLGDEIACFPDLCVHRGTALSLGWVDDGSQPAPDGSGTVGEPCLVCAYHGWSYDRRGIVRRIPAVHGRSIPNRARVTRYATTVAVGLVWVLLEPGPGGWEDPEAAYPLPDASSWWGREGIRSIPIETYDWACSAARRIENFVDFSHFPWVHPGILGDRAKPLSPEHEVIDTGTTISFDIALEEPQASVKGDVAPGEKVQRDPTTYTLHLPLSVTLDQRLPGGNRFRLFLACAPLSAKRCRSFTWNARTYKLDPSADAELAAFQAVISIRTARSPSHSDRRSSRSTSALSSTSRGRTAGRLRIGGGWRSWRAHRQGRDDRPWRLLKSSSVARLAVGGGARCRVRVQGHSTTRDTRMGPGGLDVAHSVELQREGASDRATAPCRTRRRARILRAARR